MGYRPGKAEGSTAPAHVHATSVPVAAVLQPTTETLEHMKEAHEDEVRRRWIQIPT